MYSVSKQKYGVSLTNLKAQLADWFNDEKQKYFISREDLQERAREIARQLDIDQNAVDHGFIRLGLFSWMEIKFPFNFWQVRYQDNSWRNELSFPNNRSMNTHHSAAKVPYRLALNPMLKNDAYRHFSTCLGCSQKLFSWFSVVNAPVLPIVLSRSISLPTAAQFSTALSE